MNEDVKKRIEQSLKAFAQGNLTKNALGLFQTLGYATDRQAPLDKPTYAQFKETFIQAGSRFNEEKAQANDWKYVDLLFQLTKEEVSRNTSLFDTKQVDRTIIETYLFFVIELAQAEYSRTALSHITREVNRLFPMPVLILFKYGNSLTLSVIDRRLHKRDESKDVLEKVTLIKDISIASPHRAHIEILFDLSLPELTRIHAPTNFVELHAAWRATLNISELNKKFYKRIAAWYFWAVKSVEFPIAPGVKDKKDKKVNNSINVIRLLTRLIFVWFLKEKHLVPDDLFSERALARLLKKFDGSDEKRSDYYKAILQNLFFATLNQKMNTKDEPENRRFATDERDQWGHADDYNITNLYRYKESFQNPDDGLKLFSTIPFLNGGLFDCLDKPDENDKRKVIRIDGFSRVAKNQPTVPNILFFGGAKADLEIDLSDVYDDKKHKRDKVKGLIHILNDYKFTIAENTPVEEEIALDPELLGRIFENLLAEYNPETGTTARKATGSFYTPREIVNYMVDESLIAYLKTKMLQENPATQEVGTAQTDGFGNKARKGQLKLESKVEPNRWVDKEDSLEAELRKLVGYNETPPVFTDQEKDNLVAAIHSMKVLDPACGSGAFPMGVLLKVVHVLHKLDPENRKWKQKQIEVAEQLTDSSIREETLETIEDAFSEENNFADYGRKLYLIENCIYGVDIQPIATQIAKLRFFVSLLVDQRGSDRKENRGVLSLPNLETKFVAANTLLPLEIDVQHVIKPVELYPLEDRLKKIRHDYFSAKSRKEKMKCISEDKRLREEIARILVNSAGLPKNAADKLANWDPYDQNSNAEFFDAEWMFSLTSGFDITLGNPPYVRADSGPKHLALRKAIEDTDMYETLWEKWDLYIPFIERSFKLLRPNGVSTLIVSDAYCHSKYAEKSQRWFLQNSSIIRLDFFSKIKIFDAAVRNVTYLFQRSDGSRNKPQRRVHYPEFGEVTLLGTGEQRNLTYRLFFPEDHQEQKIAVQTVPLESVCYISVGMVVHAHEDIAKGAFELEDVVSNVKDDVHTKKFVEGKLLERWVPIKHKWLEWGTHRAPKG
ncbi:MAG: hypothetical protein FJ215_00005, partial [Ignavibacteria bacterium]|nr:hypothetical protein [Ignavibacteria bacterium]